MAHTYYTEYPKEQFEAVDDKEALQKTAALVVYRDSDSFEKLFESGERFIVIRDLMNDIVLKD